jgi:hypothetical protein
VSAARAARSFRRRSDSFASFSAYRFDSSCGFERAKGGMAGGVGPGTARRRPPFRPGRLCGAAAAAAGRRRRLHQQRRRAREPEAADAAEKVKPCVTAIRSGVLALLGAPRGPS